MSNQDLLSGAEIGEWIDEIVEWQKCYDAATDQGDRALCYEAIDLMQQIVSPSIRHVMRDMLGSEMSDAYSEWLNQNDDDGEQTA
jgi:hypothetical protein